MWCGRGPGSATTAPCAAAPSSTRSPSWPWPEPWVSPSAQLIPWDCPTHNVQGSPHSSKSGPWKCVFNAIILCFLNSAVTGREERDFCRAGFSVSALQGWDLILTPTSQKLQPRYLSEKETNAFPPGHTQGLHISICTRSEVLLDGVRIASVFLLWRIFY